MSFDISTLEPQIRDILSAPGTDLQTISAKRVRKMLLESNPSLSEEVLKKHKAELDAVIATVFQSVSADAGMVEASEEPKRKRDDRRVKKEEEEEEDDDDDDAPSPPPKKARKATKKELSDAELARQLSSEINGRTRRSGAGNGSVAKKGNRKIKKSADYVDTDGSDDEGGAKKKRKAGAKGGRAKGGFAKEYLLSPPLAAVLDVTQLSRPQVVKHLWDYIKGNELQNPKDKREIMCDDGLRAVFGCDKIDMFRMNKVLGMHLHEVNE
jgi:upstream activation factor subunit UAF30